MPRLPAPGEGDESGLSSLSEYRYWKPEAQERALELIQQRQERPWSAFYCRKPKCDGLPHDDWTWNHARWDQHPPKWHADWLTWLIRSGRGAGKTRTGSEVSHRATNVYGVLRFVAPTGPDFRDTMVEDPESGILVTSPPGKRPEWEPSKKKLTWPNGAVGLGFSAEEPDRLRGKQSGYAWLDEPAHYPDPDAVWKNLLFGHRIAGKNNAQPKILCTSTPKPIQWLKDLVKDPLTVTTQVSSYANIANLAESYRKNVLDPHKGTRVGRQELEGEILEDVEGALWNWDLFIWHKEAPALRRIVVAIDPAGSIKKRADDTGIIVLGIGHDNVIYVLHDATGKYSPSGWADKSVALYEFYRADAIVAEKNYGGDMVRNTLENSRLAKAILPRIILVESRRGKDIRAEPVVALYEKKRVVHVGPEGTLVKLEDEQTAWVPGEGASPNRLDALVHGVTELAGGSAPSEMSSPTDLISDYQAPHTNPVSSVVTGPSGFWVPPTYGIGMNQPLPRPGVFTQ